MGFQFVAGADEAGRGPLAGPVVAAAVVLEPKEHIPGINDSKKLTQRRRESLYKEIIQKAIAFGIGIVSNDVIDKINILQASLLAMKQAILDLATEPDFVLIDGLYVPDLKVPMKALVQGDSKSISIAAASILAKVTRDRMMREFDLRFPEYGFARNKGYPTREHLAALHKFGACEIHRRSFAPVADTIAQPEIPFPPCSMTDLQT